MIDREVQVGTDSTTVAETTEVIRIEAIATTEIRTETTITDRADRQKGRTRTETETIAETVVKTETEVMSKGETATETETRIEIEMTAGIEDPAMTDSAQIRETDSRKMYRDRKIGMTRTGTEEITVQGHTIHTKRKIVGNV